MRTKLLRAALALGAALACAPADEPLVVRARMGGARPLDAEPPVAARPRRVGSDSRDAVAVAPGSSFEVALDGRNAELRFSSAVEAPAACRLPVRFRVEIRAGGGWQPLFEALQEPDPAQWRDHSVTLPAGSGPGRLRFATQAEGSGPRAVECAAELRPLWGSVALLGPDAAARQAPPNVVLISLDTLGASYLARFGGPPGVSPHLDAFLDEGFSFDRAYAQYGVTRTSHVSLLSGLYPLRHGAYPYDAVLPFDSLVQRLAERGYTTAAFTEGGFVSGELGFQRGFDRYDNGTLDLLNPAFRSAADETFRRASAWLGRNASGVPFFLFVHTYEVHAPYRPREDVVREFFARIQPGDTPPIPAPLQLRRIREHNDGSLPMTPEELAVLRAMHVAEIHYLDRSVGRFLGLLERLGLSGRTLVVLTADHGDQFGEHGRAGHGESLHNRVLHVPLGFRWPGYIEAGASDAPVQLVDVLPTILDLAGVAYADGLDGRSLVPLLRGEPLPERPAFSEMREAAGECTRRGAPLRCALEFYAVQTRRFKLIASDAPPEERLYDLEADPLESRDVSTAHPDELRRHRELLTAYRRRAKPRTPYEVAPLQAEEPLRDELRALGYVD